MQLKAVGESLNVKNSIENVFSSIDTSGGKNKYLILQELKKSMSSYSTETVKTAIAQSTLNKNQIKSILSSKGLTGELLESTTAELAQTTATNALAASEGIATGTTTSLGLALKGLGQTIKTFFKTNPLGWIALAAGGIFAAVKIYDAMTVSLEEATEAMSSAKQEFDNANSELETLDNSLQTTVSRIQELQELSDNGTISVVEQEELDRLKEENIELERQLSIQKELKKAAAAEEADSATDALNAPVISKYKSYTADMGNGRTVNYGKTQVSAMYELELAIGEYQRLANEQAQLDSQYDAGSISAKNYKDQTEDLKEQMTEAEQRASEMYETTGDCEQSYQDLIDSGGQLDDTQESLFNTVSDANDKYVAFIDSINGTDDSYGDLTDAIVESTKALVKNADAALSANDILSQVQLLSKGFGQLKQIYADVYDGGEFDWSSILNNESFTETFGNMENVTEEYKNAYDEFIQAVSNSPNDLNGCQSAFDKLAAAYIYNSGILGSLTNETKNATVAMLDQMGITNALELVEAYLSAQHIAERLALDELDLSNTKVIDSTYENIQALLNEANASNITTSALYDLIAKQTIFFNQDLNTIDKIRELEKLNLNIHTHCICMGILLYIKATRNLTLTKRR